MNLNESCIQLLELIWSFCTSLLPQKDFFLRHLCKHHYQAQTMQQVLVQALTILLHFISMSGKEQLVWSCRIESPTPFPLLSLSSSLPLPIFFLFFLPLSSPCLPISPLPCEIILIWIHTLHAMRHNLHTCALTHTRTLNMPDTPQSSDFTAVFIPTVFICCDTDWVMS